MPLIYLSLGVYAGVSAGADFPQARISNDSIRASLYLPDPKQRYCRGELPVRYAGKRPYVPRRQTCQT